jgi:NADH dehydrogenase/NADH:ubiquinone oxidoreductase subunit G
MNEDKKIFITIDQKQVEVTFGVNLVNALRGCGVAVPTLCWSPEIETCLGTCRVCTVKINGREGAACTRVTEPGMMIEVETAELRDLRAGLVEMLFSEGNHFCPGCEKSGDCELQGAAYNMGMTHSRFPYRFSHYDLDYRGKNLLLERNRCIHCKRCTDLFVNDDNQKVFSFIGKGHETQVMMDLDLEAKLTEHKCHEAVRLCPVGAIIFKGQGFDRPLGTRTYDRTSDQTSGRTSDLNDFNKEETK